MRIRYTRQSIERQVFGRTIEKVLENIRMPSQLLNISLTRSHHVVITAKKGGEGNPKQFDKNEIRTRALSDWIGIIHLIPAP